LNRREFFEQEVTERTEKDFLLLSVCANEDKASDAIDELQFMEVDDKAERDVE
jgi:hypothetical protein